MEKNSRNKRENITATRGVYHATTSGRKTRNFVVIKRREGISWQKPQKKIGNCRGDKATMVYYRQSPGKKRRKYRQNLRKQRRTHRCHNVNGFYHRKKLRKKTLHTSTVRPRGYTTHTMATTSHLSMEDSSFTRNVTRSLHFVLKTTIYIIHHWEGEGGGAGSGREGRRAKEGWNEGETRAMGGRGAL